MKKLEIEQMEMIEGGISRQQAQVVCMGGGFSAFLGVVAVGVGIASGGIGFLVAGGLGLYFGGITSILCAND
jgi:hypothetical protein